MKSVLPVILLLAAALAAPVRSQDAAPLEIGQPLVRELAGGDRHTFEMSLSADQFVYGEVDQQTVDVVIRVYDPDGAGIDEYDIPARGPEPFHFVTERDGTYIVEIAPFREESGRYTLRPAACGGSFSNGTPDSRHLSNPYRFRLAAESSTSIHLCTEPFRTSASQIRVSSASASSESSRRGL